MLNNTSHNHKASIFLNERNSKASDFQMSFIGSSNPLKFLINNLRVRYQLGIARIGVRLCVQCGSCDLCYAISGSCHQEQLS